MDSSDFIPGAFPLERPQSPATSTTEMRPLSVPSRWTSLCSTTAEEHPLSWHQWEVPSELLHVRPNLNVPAKLLEILQWSLQRTSKEPSSEPRVIPGQVCCGPWHPFAFTTLGSAFSADTHPSGHLLQQIATAPRLIVSQLRRMTSQVTRSLQWNKIRIEQSSFPVAQT